MDKQLLTAIASAILTFIATWYWFNRRVSVDAITKAKDAQDAKNQEIFDRIVELEKQSVLINQLVGPISTAFQAILVKELTHYHTPEMDELLIKVGPPYILTEAEEGRLAVLLRRRTEDVDALIDENEREAAIMLPYVMKRVRRITATLEQFNLVIVPQGLLMSLQRAWKKDDGAPIPHGDLI